MKQTNLLNIRLSQMQIFITVVEYGNFTTAAEKLHLTQPFISKTINKLEEELGIFLFIRSHGKLQITPAGRELYQDWKNLFAFIENSLENAHSLQEGHKGTLRVGMGELSSYNNEIILQMSYLSKICPNVSVNLEYHHIQTLLQMLKTDELDLVTISGHMKQEIENLGLESAVLYESNLAIYVHRSNPLFYRHNIVFEDLRQEKFIVLSPDRDRSYIKLLNALATEAGFAPRIAEYIPNELSFKANLLFGNGIVLADTISNLEDDDIKKFILEGKENNVLLAWKKENYKQGLQELIQLLLNKI